MWNLKINTNESICKAETDSQTQKQIYSYKSVGGRGINYKYGINTY